MKKIANYFRYIIGGFCVLLSIANFGESFIEGLFFLLFGVSLFPIIYTKMNKFKKMPIILPIILFLLFGMSIPETSNNTQDTQNTQEINKATIEQKEIIPIQGLQFDDITVELDVKENKHIKLRVNPENTNEDIDSIEFKSSNESIAKIEKYNFKNSEKYVKIIPVGEGECVIYAQFGDTIKSNEVNVKVVDNERIEKEKAAAEQAQKEAEEKAKAEAEAAKVQAQAVVSTSSSKQRKTTSTTSSTSKAKTTSPKASSNKSYGKSVYVTPTGKRYHYSPTCGGKNSTASTLSAAQARGLTPCKKCAR